jgi:hypothetical protein
MMLHETHFTVPEAQKMLDTIMPMIEEMVNLKKSCEAKGYDIYKHQYLGGMGPNGQKVFPSEMEKLVRLMKWMNDKGIEIKDPGQGLIDFPHVRANGEEVYLCYKFGETGITAWHSLEGGFSGRKPLDRL